MQIKIDNKIISADDSQTIMQIAEDNGIKIPSLCYHPDFCVKGNCRVCLVEIKGAKKLVTSCSVKPQEGMEIFTDSERVKKARNLNIELIFAEHVEKCATCVWRFKCPLLKMAEDYKVKIRKFTDRKYDRRVFKFSNAVEIDGSQCIDCRNCVDACSKLQKIGYLKIEGKGINQEIVPTDDLNKECILCGQCAVHCPVSAAQEQYQWQEVEKVIKDKNKIVVAQFAPSVRVAIGEDFGMGYGQDTTGKIVASLKKLGFNYVFDVNFGADITTVVEAGELLERVVSGKDLPMITSCCPAWVNYVEMYEPGLIGNLTTSRSPQIHIGGAIKTYWAELMKIDPKNIIVVSIMPCTAKKHEAERGETKINGLNSVDYVLTTREFSFMLKKNNINLAVIKEEKADNPLGEFSGAAAIYGSSGGVMESALRTAEHMANKGKKCKLSDERIDFVSVRGQDGLKKAEVIIGGVLVKILVVNGIGNIKKALEIYKDFHYIEVMSCPGGCIGGGGQPIPTNREIVKKRMQAIYRIDKGKSIRKAHENKTVMKYLEWTMKDDNLEKQLYTSYVDRKNKLLK